MSEIKIKAKLYSTEEESDMSLCDMCLMAVETRAPNTIYLDNRPILDLCEDHLEEIETK